MQVRIQSMPQMSLPVRIAVLVASLVVFLVLLPILLVLGVLIVGIFLLAVIWIRISLFLRRFGQNRTSNAGRENVRVIRRGNDQSD